MRYGLTIALLLLAGMLMLTGERLLAGAPPTNATERIRDMQFEPATLRIKVNGSVTWTNADDRDHTVNADDNSFSSGNLKPNDTFTFRFTKAGTFDYSCQYHPRMRGTVQVEN